MNGTVRPQQYQTHAGVGSPASLINNVISTNNLAQAMNFFAQQPPPQTIPVSQGVQPFVEKLPISLEHAPSNFNLREQILGANGANLQYIRKETGVQISLRGIGSLYIDLNTNSESQEPMHLLIEHQRLENITSAKQLAKNLIETLHQEILQFQQATRTRTAAAIQAQPPQLNMPPPNVIANVPPPSVPVPLIQHQQLSLVHQSFIPQNGLQMQLAPNGMIIQQQPPNLNVPPPSTQNAMLPIKPPNQIQLQFHQPPTGLATQHTPIILNSHPQSIQYQYIQQTTTRDVQGNQQVTLQPIIQQAHLPMPSQQQYITVQQGNTAYMVPQQAIFQSTQPTTQLSIVHQQGSSSQQAATLQMQLPIVNVQSTAQRPDSIQPSIVTNSVNNEHKTETFNENTSSSTLAIAGERESLADSKTTDEIAVESQTEITNEQLKQSMLRPPPLSTLHITSVPPPSVNITTPPPLHNFMNSALLAGNTAGAGAMLSRQHIVQSIQNEQNLMGNSNARWMQARGPLPPLGQGLTDFTQISRQPSQVVETQQPLTVTLAQPQLQHAPGSFVHLQPQAQSQPPPQHQQFSIIQTTPLSTGFGGFQQQHQLLQLSQMHPNALQVQPQPLQIHQQEFVHHQQQQMPFRPSTQAEISNQVLATARLSYKRKSTSEPESSTSGGPSPNQQIRTGMGLQSNMNKVTTNPSSTTTNLSGNSSIMAESGDVDGPDDSTQQYAPNATKATQQQQHHLKPTHIGVMRYNQTANRTAYDGSYQKPRGRSSNYDSLSIGGNPGSYSVRPTSQKVNMNKMSFFGNNCGVRIQFKNSQPSPTLGGAGSYSTAMTPIETHKNINNNYIHRRMPRP